jgi:hypothetical protein
MVVPQLLEVDVVDVAAITDIPFNQVIGVPHASASDPGVVTDVAFDERAGPLCGVSRAPSESSIQPGSY